MRRSSLIFHPLIVIACAALSVVCYAVLMRWSFPGGDLSNHFFYVLPIIVPFVSFLFDRIKHIRNVSWLEFGVDVLVVTVSIMRMMGGVPLLSGHALFLSYAIARPGTRLTRITAAIVMLQVLYLKLLVWHDMVSPVTGILAGLAAATVVRQLRLRNNQIGLTDLAKR